MSLPDPCSAPLHPQAIKGIQLFNEGHYFEAHEALEQAWKSESSPIRDLYRGILQAAVTYLHMQRRNFIGALKVADRCMRLLNRFPPICCGVNVEQLRADLATAVEAWRQRGPEGIQQMDWSLLKPVVWDVSQVLPGDSQAQRASPVYICDRCGSTMIEKNCKVTCLNCGNRFDCSDLNLYFD